MRIVIAGGSGFLGRRLTTAWLEAGDEVTILTRRPGPDSQPGPGARDARALESAGH
jgi:nucleoside-diphosphate-sugar epimerase